MSKREYTHSYFCYHNKIPEAGSLINKVFGVEGHHLGSGENTRVDDIKKQEETLKGSSH